MRNSKKAARALQWSRALVRSALARAGHDGVNALRPLWNAARSMLAIRHALLEPTRVGSPWFHRMKVCLRCPIYDPQRKTCGYVVVDGKLLGCGCYMPLKARTPEAQCWARQRGFKMGW